MTKQESSSSVGDLSRDMEILKIEEEKKKKKEEEEEKQKGKQKGKQKEQLEQR